MRQGLEKVLSMSCKSRLHSKERLRHALMAEKEEFNIAPSTSGIILVWGMRVKVLITQSCLTLCNLWTVACQAPLSMGFPWQGYRSE